MTLGLGQYHGMPTKCCGLDTRESALRQERSHGCTSCARGGTPGPRLREVLEDLRKAPRLQALGEAQRERVGEARARIGRALQLRQLRQPRLLVIDLRPAGP